jgi:hypothetical protein
LWKVELIFSEGPSFECLASYSKSKGLSEPEFEKITYDSTKEDCVQAIKNFSDKVRADIIEKMNEVATDSKQSECIKAKFTSDDTFVNNIIKGEAFAAIEEKEKSDKLREVENFAEEFITTAISSCIQIE